MAARFWVGGTGNWDASDTTHWSATSGGAGGASVPGASDDVTFDASSGGGTITVTATQSVLSITGGAHTGTFDTNGQSITVGTFNYSGTGTRTLTLGASTITVTGSNTTVWNITTPTNITFNANTSTIVLTGSFATFTGNAALTYNNITCQSNSNQTVNTLVCSNFTKTGHTVKTDTLTLNGNITCSSAFTCSSNSAINRIQVLSSTVGTARTITAASVVISNIVDFQDITGAGAATWTVAGTGATALGDCGGNSGITFSPSVTQSPSDINGFNWSTATWTSRVPLPQDDVVVNTALGLNKSIACDMPRLGRSIDFSSLTWTGTMSLNLGSTNNSIFGSLTLKSGFTMTGSNTTTFSGRSSYTITSAGNIINNSITFTNPSGTITLVDDLNMLGTFTINNGTFITNNFNVTALAFAFSNSNTRSITMGTSVFTATATTASTLWNLGTTTGLTFSGASSTIVFSTASTNTRTFAGGGQTYGVLTYTVAGSTGQLSITGSNSFAGINFSDASNARSIKFTAGTTTTIRNAGGFNVNGTSGKLMTVDSITAATHTLSSTVSHACNYINVINSIATGGGTFYAGANSTNGGGNTGWRFSFALSFNGANGYVTAGTTDPSAAAMSVGAWINWGSINAGTTSQVIMSKHDGFANSTMRWWFGLDKTNNYKLLVYGNDAAFPFWNYTPPNGTPTHVVWVHNTTAGSETLYVNGTLHSNITGITLGTATSTHVQIGASTNGSAEYYKGTIDGVFVNSGTLSPAQVGSVYGGLDANTLSNAYMTYHMDEGTGTTTADSTGGRTGTLSGATAPTWVGGIETIFSGGVAHAMIMMLGIG